MMKQAHSKKMPNRSHLKDAWVVCAQEKIRRLETSFMDSAHNKRWRKTRITPETISKDKLRLYVLNAYVIVSQAMLLVAKIYNHGQQYLIEHAS